MSTCHLHNGKVYGMSKRPKVTIKESGTTTIITKGNVEVRLDQKGNVEVYTAGKVSMHRPAPVSSAVPSDLPKIGDKMKDGTIFAGATGLDAIYAARQDVQDAAGKPLKMSFHDAVAYARKMNAENYLGHNDWHVPSNVELGILYRNKDAGGLKGTFATTAGENTDYVSGTMSYEQTRFHARRFEDGMTYEMDKLFLSHLRLVRSVPIRTNSMPIKRPVAPPKK